jgi:glycosyltransferase involved in cell wall biosynthesis
MRASVVVCAYDLGRWDRTVEAVRSVLAQDTAVAEVLVVIDHNPELLERALDMWPDLPVRVAPNAGTRGLSGARNTGVAMSSSEVVAFLDDDAVAEPTWMGRLLASYADDSVVACGGRVEPVLGAARPGWWPAEFDWVVGCSYVGLPTVRADVRNVIGANMSARRASVVEAGGFQEGIGRVGTRPVGCEETDLLIRLGQSRSIAGKACARVVYEPAAVVHHWVPPARLSWRYFRARCLAEGFSKAQVTASVGSERALASERSYTLKVLPLGMARALVQGAPLQALAIAAGLALTIAGYVGGVVPASRRSRRRPRT